MAARINRLCRQTGMLEYQASWKTGLDGRHGELEDTTGFMPRCACLLPSLGYPTNFGVTQVCTGNTVVTWSAHHQKRQRNRALSWVVVFNLTRLARHWYQKARPRRPAAIRQAWPVMAVQSAVPGTALCVCCFEQVQAQRHHGF